MVKDFFQGILELNDCRLCGRRLDTSQGVDFHHRSRGAHMPGTYQLLPLGGFFLAEILFE